MLKPITSAEWDLTRAAHLINRAGFGGTPSEIQALADMGPEQAVSRLVFFERIPDPTPDPEWAKPDPERAERLAAMRRAPEMERREMQRKEQQQQRERLLELRAWWLQRMVRTPRPLQEKLTLFWHGHFATSAEKVRDAYYMWRQNELFRRLAAGNWLEMLVEVGKDPAMLIWLDQAQSRKEKPNENFAREVMELFALGEGHYTEKDVSEAARAFTGWSLDRNAQRFVERPRAHDSGSKTVLGKTGEFKGEDVLEIIVSQPQAARFITAKLWNWFAGTWPSAPLNEALASEFRAGGNAFQPLLRTLLLSREFHEASVIRSQVKSPVQWLVGSVRMLECELPPAPVCVSLLRNLGQDLFAPPNVKGWDGGLAWINTNTLLTRFNESAVLVEADPSAMARTAARTPAQKRRIERRMQRMRPGGVQVDKLVKPEELKDPNRLLASLENRLLQSRLKDQHRDPVLSYLKGKGDLDEAEIRTAIRMVMSTPEYQLA